MKARGAPPAPKLSAAVSHLVEAPTWTVETLARVLPLGAAAAVVAAGLNGNGPVVAPVPSDAGALLSNATALIGTPAETTEARFERWLALFRSTARPDAHAADLAAAILDMAHSVFLHVAETATASKPSSSVATGNEGHHHAPVALRFQAASTFQAERRARLIEALRRALDESLLSPAQFLAAQLPFLLDLPTNCLAAVLLQRSIVTRPSSISLDPTATLVVPWFLLFGAPMLRHVREDVKALSATILDSYAAALLRCSNMTPSPYPPPPGSRVHVPARSGALVKAVDLVECGPTEAWDLLYSSGHDGFAMTSFAECVLDYPGPTLLLVRDETGAVFGMHVAERWQDTTVSWGTDGCRLIQLVPKLAVHRPTGRQRLYAYFNSTSTSRQVLGGVGAGGTAKVPYFYVDSTLQNGAIGGPCATYPSVGYDERRSFEVRQLEVWGLGGQKAADYQRDQRHWERRQVEKERHKIDAPSEWAVDKTLLDWMRPTEKPSAEGGSM